MSKHSNERLEESLTGSSEGHSGLWLGVAVVITLLVLDFFFGGFTKTLVLGQAKIVVMSNPSGAKVIADTQMLGTTPLTEGKLLPGSYMLRVEHPHFEPSRESIEVTRGDVVERSVQLERAYGTLRLVTNPRGAAIRLNGELQEEVTPATLEGKPAGLYDVELSIEGRTPVREQLDVQRGARASLNAELNRIPMAQLLVDLTPADAQVELLGTSLAYEPRMKLPPGTYELRVTKEGYVSAQQSVRLSQGSRRLAISLERERALLSVTVSPPDAQVSVTADGESRIYSEPLSLPLGQVRVAASKPGFRRVTKTLRLDSKGAQLALVLNAYEVTPGRKFRDALKNGGQGPELVVLAAGSFRMGDLQNKGVVDERPVHRVALAAPFAIGVREVSRAEWAMQFAQTNEVSDAQLPVTSVSLEKIEAYLSWLSISTGERYRLPSEAQWEFAARAGSEALYGTNELPQDLCRYANVADKTMEKKFDHWVGVPCDDGHVRLAPTGSFAPNAFGLFDIVGNASEWVADCWHDNYDGAPSDGRIWGSRCYAWVSRGGSWDTVADNLRLSFRKRITREKKSLGFRLVRDL